MTDGPCSHARFASLTSDTQNQVKRWKHCVDCQVDFDVTVEVKKTDDDD